MTAYQVDEIDQAIVLQLGKPVRVVIEPGLHFKLPWPIQSVIFLDKRLLDYDSNPTEILTRDKKNLVLDNYAKWRIIDPLKFYVSVRDENGAQARLDDIIYSELRVELGKHDLDEVVTKNREDLMANVTTTTNEAAKAYGIEVVDVRIKRADLPAENERSVYERMRAERKRIANQYRSEGEEEALKIRAAADSMKVTIMANAYKEAQTIRGQAEGKAIDIYAKAVGKDPDFYDFLRSMEAYRKIIDTSTVLVLPPETEWLKWLK
ncbi:MAG: protease modulator HflC [Calditrichaeota bacterium]|nr:protease modulator HflC [Calditrichota bacterium]